MELTYIYVKGNEGVFKDQTTSWEGAPPYPPIINNEWSLTKVCLNLW